MGPFTRGLDNDEYFARTKILVCVIPSCNVWGSSGPQEVDFLRKPWRSGALLAAGASKKTKDGARELWDTFKPGGRLTPESLFESQARSVTFPHSLGPPLSTFRLDLVHHSGSGKAVSLWHRAEMALLVAGRAERSSREKCMCGDVFWT